MLWLLLACANPAAVPRDRDVVVGPPVPPIPQIVTEDAGSSPTTEPAVTSPVTFTDVSAEAGIEALQWAIGPYEKRGCAWTYLMGGGAAAEDYDGDGDVDLFVTRFHEPSLLYRNRGDGIFEDVAASVGIVTTGFANGALWLDVEGDGDLDLLVTRIGEQETNLLYVQDRGAFTEEGAARGLDMPVAAAERCSRQFSASAGDYDLDGDLDLHVSQWNNITPDDEPSRTRLLRNDGGVFVDVSEAAGVLVRDIAAFTSGFTDLDLDGWPDLWIVADFGESRVFRNHGDGTFEDVTDAWGAGVETNGMGAAVGDWDADGDPDLLATAIYPGDPLDCGTPNWGCSGNVLYANTPGVGFTEDADAGVRDGGWAWGATFADVDLDGDLDLFQASGEIDSTGWPYGPESPRLFLNDSGTFTDVAAPAGLAPKGLGRAALALDVDGDGDLDLLQTANAGYPTLWRNDLAGGGWLGIRLRATGANPQAIGARVTVTAVEGGPSMVRWIDANSRFVGQEPAVAWFGLGAPLATVHEVRVAWPRGGERVWTDVGAGALVTLTEE